MTLFRRLPVTGAKHEPPQGFSAVQPAWKGETAAIVACGPSVTQKDVDRLRGRCRVVVINDSYRLALWADVHYFADRKWHEQHCNAPEFAQFQGERATLQVGHWDGGFVEGLHYLQRDGPVEGLSSNPATVRTGNNSGHQALNAVVHSAAVLILLLGFDACVPRKGPAAGKKHWFGNHWDNSEPPYATMRESLRTVDREAKARGIRIVNCSPISAIETFEKASLESFLPDKTPACVS